MYQPTTWADTVLLLGVACAYGVTCPTIVREARLDLKCGAVEKTHKVDALLFVDGHEDASVLGCSSIGNDAACLVPMALAPWLHVMFT